MELARRWKNGSKIHRGSLKWGHSNEVLIVHPSFIYRYHIIIQSQLRMFWGVGVGGQTRGRQQRNCTHAGQESSGDQGKPSGRKVARLTTKTAVFQCCYNKLQQQRSLWHWLNGVWRLLPSTPSSSYGKCHLICCWSPPTDCTAASQTKTSLFSAAENKGDKGANGMWTWGLNCSQWLGQNIKRQNTE